MFQSTSGFRCGSDLVKIAHDEAITKKWLGRLENFYPDDAPRAFVGTIASGEALLASRRSPLFQYLRDNFNQAIAVEMEGYGFLQACYDKKVPGLVVRGISDLLSGKKKTDAGGSQEVASRNATAFALQVLSKLETGERRSGKMIGVPQSSTIEGDGTMAEIASASPDIMQEALSISGEILRCIEESDIPLSRVVLKAIRLARLLT